MGTTNGYPIPTPPHSTSSYPNFYEVGMDGYRYKFHDEYRTWYEAKATCEAEGAQLATIKSKKTQEYLETKYQSHNVWIGLTDLHREGEFEFVDGSKLDKSMSFWWTGEPNDVDHNENCVHTNAGMENYRQNPGQWNDLSCSHRLRFLCQKSKSG